MRLWFARDIWRYRNVFWLIDWSIDWWNVTLVFKAKALDDVVGVRHLALVLIVLVLALEFAAWLRLPYGESH